MFILVLLSFTFQDGCIRAVPLVENGFWLWLTQWGERSKLGQLHLCLIRGCTFNFSLIMTASILSMGTAPYSCITRASHNASQGQEQIFEWIHELSYRHNSVDQPFLKKREKIWERVKKWASKMEESISMAMWAYKIMFASGWWLRMTNEKGLPDTDQSSS